MHIFLSKMKSLGLTIFEKCSCSQDLSYQSFQRIAFQIVQLPDASCWSDFLLWPFLLIVPSSKVDELLRNHQLGFSQYACLDRNYVCWLWQRVVLVVLICSLVLTLVGAEKRKALIGLGCRCTEACMSGQGAEDYSNEVVSLMQI